MCVFVYSVDNVTEPVTARAPMQFTEVYLAAVAKTDFRRNKRRGTGDEKLGTDTSTLDRSGLAKLRRGWVYRLAGPPGSRAARNQSATVSAASAGTAVRARRK